MLKRYFISNIILMVLLNLLVKPFWIFAIDRNVQNVVGYKTYGLYAALYSLSVIFNILLDLGITNYNNKTIAENPSLIHRFLPNMLVAKGLLSFFYLALLVVVAFVFRYQAAAVKLLLSIGCVQLLNSLLLFLRSNVSAHHDFKIDSVLSVLDRFIMIAVCGYLLFTPIYRAQFHIEWFIYAQVIAYGCSILVSLAIIYAKYSKISFSHVQLGLVKELVVKSLPYAILILLMGIYMRLDSVMLERMLPLDGDYQNGLYISAFRILDALNMFGFLFAGILLPMFSRMLSKGNRVGPLVITTTNILLPMSFIIVSHSFFYYHEIMQLLYNQNTIMASEVYRFVILCFPAYCLMYIYSTLLTANGSIRLLIYIALGASILSIGLNFILIPTFKVQAVAWVGVLVHWLSAFVYLYYCTKKTDFKLSLSWSIKFLFLFSFFLLINYFFKYRDITISLSIIYNIIIFLPAVFISKLWKVQDLRNYFANAISKGNM